MNDMIKYNEISLVLKGYRVELRENVDLVVLTNCGVTQTLGELSFSDHPQLT